MDARSLVHAVITGVVQYRVPYILSLKNLMQMGFDSIQFVTKVLR